MIDKINIKVQKLIDEIKSDNTSGSIDLAKKSAETLIILSEENCSLDQIQITAKSLVKAQPTMASIFNLCNNLLFNIDKFDKEQYAKYVNKYCKKFLLDLEKSDKLVNKIAYKLIKNDSTILTHSFSSTVLKTLLYAKESGLDFSVICTESRPKNEGVNLARILGKNHIKVKLIVDSAVFSFLIKADAVLVGADAITSNGLINKIGTFGLAMFAHKNKKPVYALGSSIKFLPKDYKLNLHQRKNSKEIISNNLSNITVLNYYFDQTPLNFFTGIVTEEKILDPSEIKQKINHMKIHSSLI